MPEIPDLEAYAGYLNQRLPGRTIVGVDLQIPYVVRVPREEFVAAMTGQVFAPVRRHAKYLLFAFESGKVMVVQAMLTGRYQWVEPGVKVRKRPRTVLIFELDGGYQLRYHDMRVMGRIYLTDIERLAELPRMAVLGPDAMDVALTEEVFRRRIQKYRGQVKSILTNEEFIGGIGNAYADEVLWWAGVHPYTKRIALSDEEVGRLYRSIREVMEWAIPKVREQVEREGIDIKPRDFLNVHRLGGQPCPRCGSTISEIAAGQRITSFCRTCQPEIPGGKG